MSILLIQSISKCIIMIGKHWATIRIQLKGFSYCCRYGMIRMIFENWKQVEGMKKLLQLSFQELIQIPVSIRIQISQKFQYYAVNRSICTCQNSNTTTILIFLGRKVWSPYYWCNPDSIQINFYGFPFLNFVSISSTLNNPPKCKSISASFFKRKKTGILTLTLQMMGKKDRKD